MTTLKADLVWEAAPAAPASTTDVTWGFLRVRLGSRWIWAASEGRDVPGIRWTWIDLLEHLATSWPWLVGEQGWPPDILATDLSPAFFDAERERALGDLAPPERTRIDAALFDFRERHDLSCALPGKTVPRFWIVRQGHRAWVGGRHPELVAWADVKEFLVALGDQIAARLGDARGERAIHVRSRWAERDRADSVVRAEAVTGLDAKRLNAFLPPDDLASTLELDEVGFEPTELAFAARLAGSSLSGDVTRKVLDCIRRSPLGAPSPTLAELAEKAAHPLTSGHHPFDQGVALARWLRGSLGIPDESPIGPTKLLSTWNVAVTRVDVGDPRVDAVACWGRRHGPAVYVNASGRHARDRAGRRATVAHEIAHLLVDRAHGLPLSEIQGSVHRSALEQRANAFAAELLLPQAIAGPAFASIATVAAARELLQRLAKKFTVSREIIAWQALNSGSALSRPTLTTLSLQVPAERRWRFSAAAE